MITVSPVKLMLSGVNKHDYVCKQAYCRKYTADRPVNRRIIRRSTVNLKNTGKTRADGQSSYCGIYYISCKPAGNRYSFGKCNASRRNKTACERKQEHKYHIAGIYVVAVCFIYNRKYNAKYSCRGISHRLTNELFSVIVSNRYKQYRSHSFHVSNRRRRSAC